MFGQNMGFLRTGRDIAGNNQGHIHHFAYGPPIFSQKRGGLQPLLSGNLNGGNDIWRITAGADGEQNIPFNPQGLHLLGKNLFKGVVISDTGNH